MSIDFDEPVDRRGTDCLKWDATGRFVGIEGDDVLSMWIADTDFRAPDVVRQALRKITDFGVFGYGVRLEAMREALRWWMRHRHDWEVSEEAILTSDGLGNAIALVIDTLTEPGDGVVTFTPVYHEFAAKIRRAERRPVEVPLLVEDGRQSFDLDRAASMLDGSEKLLLLCSPQNPGGRVWTEDELRAVAAFAEAHDLWVVADEIHHDLVLPGARFRPMAAVGGIEDRLITLVAPSKTFNLAGLRLGQMVIEDDALRGRITKRISSLDIQPNMMGVAACAAAYSEAGAAWLDAQIAYIDANRRVFDAGINTIPGARSTPLEATYLAWVDFSGTGLSHAEVEERVIERARIAVNNGTSFGPGGERHMRFNIGTQRNHVENAVARLAAAFEGA
ncbi:MAG: PatB family C-S lyase [Pseudomonadota bacterium]